jgi:hypothetical protein
MDPSGKMERVEKRGMAFEFTLLFIRGRDAGNARFSRDSSEIGPRLKRDGEDDMTEHYYTTASDSHGGKVFPRIGRKHLITYLDCTSCPLVYEIKGATSRLGYTSNWKLPLRADSDSVPWAMPSHPFVTRRRHFIHLVYVMKPKIRALGNGNGRLDGGPTLRCAPLLSGSCPIASVLWKISSHSPATWPDGISHSSFLV